MGNFVAVPQSRDELIVKLVHEYLITDRAPQVSELDFTSILKLPSTWGMPHELAIEIGAQLRQSGRQGASSYAASVLNEPGLLLAILGDEVGGHVLVYTGSAANPDKPAYLVVRSNGLEWHAPLTNKELASAANDSLDFEARLEEAYDLNYLTVARVIDSFKRLIRVPLKDEDLKAYLKLRRDLWNLRVVTRADSEVMTMFSMLCYDINLLARRYETSLEELMAKAKTEMRPQA